MDYRFDELVFEEYDLDNKYFPYLLVYVRVISAKPNKSKYAKKVGNTK